MALASLVLGFFLMCFFFFFFVNSPPPPPPVHAIDINVYTCQGSGCHRVLVGGCESSRKLVCRSGLSALALECSEACTLL